jgi:hypothetical protein
MATTSFGGALPRHAELGGLGSNDHPQYALISGTSGIAQDVSIPLTGTAGTVSNVAYRLGSGGTGLAAHPNGTAYLLNNQYYDGSAWRQAVASSSVSSQLAVGGAMVYFTSAAGAAGGPATNVQQFSIDVNGEALVRQQMRVGTNTGEGYAYVTRGSTGRAGYVAFHAPSGTRQCYVGW